MTATNMFASLVNMNEAKRADEFVSVIARVSREEYELIVKAAEKDCRTMSNWARVQLVAAAKEGLEQ